MREMGNVSGVAIEPSQQTQLLDDCLAVPGVIAGGVPGGIYVYHTLSWSYHILTHPHFLAGGYDAIWLLVFDPPKKHGEIPTPVACVEIMWGRREKKDVTPLRAEESTTKGIQVEQLDKVPGLREAISPVQN
jgi:phosphomevalonate kinase